MIGADNFCLPSTIIPRETRCSLTCVALCHDASEMASLRPVSDFSVTRGHLL